MKRLLLAFLVCAVSTIGCKRKPCEYGPWKVDDRPLPADWASVAVAPDGASMCISVRDHEAQSNIAVIRYYDVPSKSAEEAYQKWQAAFAAHGWTKVPASRPKGIWGFDPEPCHIYDRFDHGPDVTMHIRLNKCSNVGPGHTYVVFDRRDKK